MKRISGCKKLLQYLLLVSAVVLAGCAKQSSLPPQGSAAPKKSDSELLAAIQKLRNKSEDLKVSQGMYRRQMVLDFDKTATSVSDHQQKVIKLFFQTLPNSNDINIIITAAPSSNTGFTAINDAWVRIKLLSNHLKAYSEQIEELYLPDQKTDTVTIQVLGGDRVQ